MCYLATDLADLLDLSESDVLQIAEECHCDCKATDEGDFEIVVDSESADRFEWLTGLEVLI